MKVAACLLPLAAGHGDMVWPMPRQNTGCKEVDDAGIFLPGSYGQAIEWYNHWCVIDEPVCDPSKGNGQMDGQRSRHPGNDPGLAPMLHPCSGAYLDEQHFADFTGGNFCGRTFWKANETVEVITSINNNHGGHYQFRLCPLVNRDYAGLKEADCAEHVVEFASKKIGKKPKFSGKKLPGSPATEFVDAVDRAGKKDGSMWRNVDHATVDGSLYVDELQVPNLPDGEYVLQWRWDCIETAQVWSSCSDVTLSPTPAPPTPPRQCHAIAASVTDDWCKTSCLATPRYCPPTLCSCDEMSATLV